MNPLKLQQTSTANAHARGVSPAMADDIGKRPPSDPAASDLSKYLIYSRLEIAAILDALRKSGSMVTAYFGGGDDFILTSIVAVMPNEGTVIIDCGADAASNERALQAKRITFVAAHERIRIQFVVEALGAARFNGCDALSMPLPATLLRLQRREFFRIATPRVKPLVCVIAPKTASAHVPAEVAIVDISCGGIAIIDTGGPSDIETGLCLRGCRIALPELGEVSTDIIVKSTFEVMFRNGTKHTRAGCEFLNMRERDRALIQRYINKMERERKERSGPR